MFTAFEGPPNIVRLYGTGKVFELGTPEYNELLPLGKRQPGSRAVIWVDVHKVGTVSNAFVTQRASLLNLSFIFRAVDFLFLFTNIKHLEPSSTKSP